MEQRGREAWRQRWWWLVLLAVMNLLRSGALAQIRYSVFEEMDEGTVVGNIAKDLGLDKSTLNSRGYRIVVGTNDPLFQRSREQDCSSKRHETPTEVRFRFRGINSATTNTSEWKSRIEGKTAKFPF
ncbi:unnamed protein product [Arctogadus glacialis]